MPKNQARGSPFGPALKYARLSAGLSMAASAEKSGLTKTAVAQEEAGRGRLDTVLVLARSLDPKVYPDVGTTIGDRLARQSGVSAPTNAGIEAGEPALRYAANME